MNIYLCEKCRRRVGLHPYLSPYRNFIPEENRSRKCEVCDENLASWLVDIATGWMLPFKEVVTELKRIIKTKEYRRVRFCGDHDIVEKGDIGYIEKELTEGDRKRYQELWSTKKPYNYQVNFNGTVLIVSEDEVSFEEAEDG